MGATEIISVVEQLWRAVESLHDAGVQELFTRLLNLVEHVMAENARLQQENACLRSQLGLPTDSSSGNPPNPPRKPRGNVSSEKERRQHEPRKPPSHEDRRSFQEIPVHEERICPVDPAQLPPDARFVGYRDVVVQEIRIEPHNIRFRCEIWHSDTQQQHFHGPLPSGYQGEFGPELKALLVSLKYVAGTSEPGARELLEGYGVQISPGSVSNILLKTAELFDDEKAEIYRAGLAATSYQHLDDTSARVGGQHWHTHIVGNPYYTAYFTTPRKDRLTVLDVLRNFAPRTYRWNDRTWRLLEELHVPAKWRAKLRERTSGEPERDWSQEEMERLLAEVFPDKSSHRTPVLEAAAIAAYQSQTELPVPILVGDDAGQFKLLTPELGLCWIHNGRHYKQLTPVIPQHQQLLEGFRQQFWDYYAQLETYRRQPEAAEAARLSAEFDRLFSTCTGYEALDARIAKTAGKKEHLLTVLKHPEMPPHNNPAELGCRVSARRRDVSLHTQNERGTRSMDTYTTIVQTAKKLGVQACRYLRDRISRQNLFPSLASLIQAQTQIVCPLPALNPVAPGGP